MKKILISILVVLVLAVSTAALTACESTDTAGGQGSPSESEASESEASESGSAASIAEDGKYDSKEDVSKYLSIYKKLPKNYITKKEAKKMGWHGGSLEPYAKGKTIGGDHFGNYEKKLPEKSGRKYYECDIDTLGAKKRGPKRIIYSNDGLIYYTGNHYKSFEKMPESA